MIWLWAMLAQGADLGEELDARWQQARQDVVWRSPTVSERRALREATARLAQGECELLEPTRAALAQVDLRLDLVEDEESRVVVIWEGQGEHRGAGLYAVRCGPARPLVLAAPHPLYEAGTRPLSLALFLEGEARALTWSTAHRYRATPDEQRSDPVHPADPTREHGSLFHAATMGLATAPELRFVQVHGFDRGPDFAWDAVVSQGWQGSAPVGLKTRLEPVLGRVAAYPADTSELGGTVNVQGRALYRAGGPVRFLHLELSPQTRKALGEEERQGLLEALEGAW